MKEKEDKRVKMKEEIEMSNKLRKKMSQEIEDLKRKSSKLFKVVFFVLGRNVLRLFWPRAYLYNKYRLYTKVKVAMRFIEPRAVK